MPRFYFDFDDDGGTFIDKDGEEFADVDAAKREAMAALGDAARDFCRSSPGGAWQFLSGATKAQSLNYQRRFEAKSLK